MGEIARSVFGLISFLTLSLSFASTTYAIGPVGSGANRPGQSQCPALFLPFGVGAGKAPSKPEIGWNGFVDKDGNPIQEEPPKAASPGTALAIREIVVADYAPVYSDKTIHKLLTEGKNIPEELLSTYERMAERGQNRFLVLPYKLTALDHLYKTMPNFKQALDEIKKSLALSLAAQEPIRLPHLILLGDPGLGKTRFANAVAKALGLGYDFISMNSVTAGWVLSGAHATWKNAVIGRVAKLLVEKDYANPLIVVDEIDKATVSENQKTLTSLHQLWEVDTARAFRDEFLDIDVDASHINWIATANDISGIPKPILDRATVITIPKPTKEEMRAVMPSIFADVLAEKPKLQFDSKIPEEVFLRLYTYTPRQVAKLLKGALGNAVLDGRRHLEPKDIDIKALEQPEQKRGIGFFAEF